MFAEIKAQLTDLYLTDPRPWLIGFSGGKDSTVVAAMIFEVVAGIPESQRKKPIALVCTDTRVEIPAIVEMTENTLARMQKFSRERALNIEVNLLRPPPEQSFWVNIIGRGYPPPNRTFRWSIILICSRTNQIEDLLPLADAILQTLETIQPGQAIAIPPASMEPRKA